MKKKNVLGIVLSLCSATFYVLAIIGFSSGGDTATAAIWLCLGSALLCISTVFHRRTSEDEKKGEEAVEDMAEDVIDDEAEDVIDDEAEDVSEDKEEENAEE